MLQAWGSQSSRVGLQGNQEQHPVSPSEMALQVKLGPVGGSDQGPLQYGGLQEASVEVLSSFALFLWAHYLPHGKQKLTLVEAR